MDLGDEHFGVILSARISKVVEKLRLYLGNSNDSFKSITKKLDVLEDKLRFLNLNSLQLIKPDKEEAAAAWLRRLEKASHDAEGLLEDMESEVKARNSSDSSVMTWLSSDNGNMIRMIYIISKLASVYSEEPTSLEFRKEANQTQISQKGWITETLQKTEMSKWTQQATEVSPYLKNEMGNKVGYNSTVTYLQNPTVIPIVGVSGVGKSALAQFIFNDRNVQEYFADRFAWVYMTDKINQLDVIKKIIYSFDREYDLNDVIDLESAHIELQNIIEGAKRLEDVAGEWFHELVNRAFLQPSVCKTGYIMHDLVWDFASALSSNEYHGINSSLRGVSQDVRYLSIDMEGLNALPKYINIKQLRTVILIGDIDQPSSNEIHHPLGRIFDCSTSLRLLDLSSCSLGIVIPNDMSALKHLRYLDLSFTGIKTVPDSVCSLCHLQVLGLRGCTLDELPGNINSLINLRHLHASSDTIAKINGIGKLTKLQELHRYHIKAEDGHRITELRDMNDLSGSLCISKLDMVTNLAEALEANIVGKKYLTTLELRWSAYNLAEASPDLILEGLSPPTYLQDLKLYGYSGFAFPGWLSQLKHVRTVEISSCKNLKVLPPLGQLENLQKVKLDKLPSIKHIESEFYGTSNVVFRSLEELSFGFMESWESWMYSGSNEFIPNLQKLRIDSCSLSKVPFESLSSSTKEIILWYSGLHGDTVSRYLQRLTCVTHLERFTLEYCDQIQSIPPNSLPGNLKELQIEGGSFQLETRCQNPNGEVWQPKGRKMVQWREEKMKEWRRSKIMYGHDKMNLFKMQRMKKEQQRLMMDKRMKVADECEHSFSKEENPWNVDEQLEEEEPLDEWLQPSHGDKHEWRLLSWVPTKLDQALIGKGSLVKERDEWLKEEECKLLEILGKDWPNISHVVVGFSLPHHLFPPYEAGFLMNMSLGFSNTCGGDIYEYYKYQGEPASPRVANRESSRMAADVSSAIVAEVVSVSHVIKIDGYSRIKELIENGKYVSSIPFSVGGNSWIITFYPNGNAKESEDYLSFFLSLDSTCAKDV
ncbi:hypothetical protein ABZP36_000812 [Zizania latifolia]